jgi:hypothetical protein
MKRHRNFFSVLLLASLLACSNVSQKQENNFSSDIVGEWSLTVKQVNYPKLIFNPDSTAVFTSMGDTIYRYRYYVEQSELVLKDINEQLTRDKILKLDKDSLVFETLANNRSVQRYIRNQK